MLLIVLGLAECLWVAWMMRQAREIRRRSNAVRAENRAFFRRYPEMDRDLPAPAAGPEGSGEEPIPDA